MTSRITNKNGVKLLATMMVFAVAIAGICIASSDSDVEGVTEYITGAEGVVTTGDDGTIIIDGKATVSSNYELTADVLVKNSGSLTIPKDIVVTGNKKITIDEGAKLIVAGQVGGSITIENSGLITLVSEEARIEGAVNGFGTIDASAAQSEGTISGEWNTTTTYTENQKITISADTTLVSGTQIVILGTLVVPEDVTLTIATGAQLVVYGTFAKLENNGNIVVKSDAGAAYVTGSAWAQPSISTLKPAGGFIIGEKSEIINNGAITLDFEETDTAPRTNWQMVIDSKIFTNNGEITIGEDSSIFIGKSITNSKDASISIYGTIMTNDDGDDEDQVELRNAGSIVLDGYIRQDYLRITHTDASATTTIESVTPTVDASTVIISNGIPAGKRTYVTDTAASIELEIDNTYAPEGAEVEAGKPQLVVTLGKLEITADVEKDVVHPSKYVKTIMISGQVSVDRADPTETAEIDGIITQINAIPKGNGKVIVSEDLTLASHVGLDVWGEGALSVAGTLKTAERIENYSIVAVEGTIESNTPVVNIGNATVDAAYYKVTKTTTSGNDKHIYTTLADAVASGSTRITVYGKNVVDSDLTIPATSPITLDEDSQVTIKDTAKVSVDEGSYINFISGSEVIVEGTLYLADKKTGVKGTANVNSQVISEGDKDRTYTNLSDALGGASEGSTVMLSDNVEVEDSLTIPAGIKVDSKEKSITVNPGASITVNGTLFLNSGDLILQPQSENAQAAKLVLNGSIVSTDDNISEFEIQCAYYQITDGSATTYYYIEPIETAVENIIKADDSTIELLVDSKIKDLSISGTTDEDATVIVRGNLSAGTITLDNACIKFTDGKTVEAGFTNETGAVVLKGTAGNDLNVKSTTKDSTKTLTVSGIITELESEDPAMKISDAATVEKVVVTGEVVVEGTLTVSGTPNTITQILNNGTVNVKNKATLTNVTTFENMGAIIVAEKDADGNAAGKLVVTDLFMGITKADVTTGAVATISGSVEAVVVIVSSGTTVPADIVENANSTEYYIEDSLWITVYDNTGSREISDVSKAPIENAYFNGGWLGEDKVTSVTSQTVGATGFQKVYADAAYNIYNVTIIGDAGIGSVAIDGVVLISDGNTFSAPKLVAGNHKVTYVLNNGFEGEATLYQDGVTVSNNTIVLSGSPTTGESDVKVTYTLSGTNPVSTVTPVTPVTPESGDDDMGLTEYLLIVLVILAAILVIVVAIRMMRS